MYPERIVCLTEETTETLYLLGEENRIVGISGFTVRPPRARKEKPKVSAFTSAHIDKIAALKPDLVLGFSDLQADIAAQLIRLGIPVHVFNQRSVAQILQMMAMLGALVGRQSAAEDLVAQISRGLDDIRESAQQFAVRPKVYFEEWDSPQISGIGWVSELVQLAGGMDCFPELARESLGKNRIIADPLEVARRAPDIIFGSWCGKKFRPASVAARAGWGGIPAVRNGDLFEIKSPLILQPGPAALTDGVRALHAHIAAWAMRSQAVSSLSASR
jgi:iron complex transport system substrate-binding protein